MPYSSTIATVLTTLKNSGLDLLWIVNSGMSAYVFEKGQSQKTIMDVVAGTTGSLNLTGMVKGWFQELFVK